MKKALVTGAAGFIGSHLVDELLIKNYKVTGIDNLSTGQLSNLDLAMKNLNFEFTKSDICEQKQDLDGPIDVIFHAASPASPPKYFSLPIETMNVNSIGTKNMIEIAIKNNARLIYFSTSEVYGDPLVHPQSEEYFGNVNPIGPRSIYDESKRFGEALISQYVREKKLNAGIIRIFNTYGPRLDPFDGRVISTFLRQAENNEALTINGSGEQTRSFCYVTDLVNGILKMSEVNIMGPINLGNPFEISLNNLVKVFEKILDKKLNTTYLPGLEDDPIRRKPDISKAENFLNWTPIISLEEGLRACLS